MKFVRIVKIEFSEPTLEPQSRSFEIDGVAITVRPRDPDEAEILRLLVAAEVPLDTRPDVDGDGKIVSPAPVEITQDMLSDLEDRRDGVSLLAEALANSHETGRFRELARFYERAFRAPPAGIVSPLSLISSVITICCSIRTARSKNGVICVIKRHMPIALARDTCYVETCVLFYNAYNSLRMTFYSTS
jgi:hypothetical protein